MRFIEWIELLRNQGVDKIFLKVYAVHPNVMKVIIRESKDRETNEGEALFQLI